MKILYWTDLFLPDIGGVEIFSAKLIPLLQDCGHEIAVVSSNRSPGNKDQKFYNPDDISVYRFPFWEALKQGNIKQLIEARRQITKFKQDFKPDLVHIHFGATSLFHLQTLNAYFAPTLTTIHSLRPSSLSSQSLFQKMLNHTDWMNVVSVSRLREIRQFAPEITERSSNIYYGLDSPDVEVKLPSFVKPQLLCLGRLVPKKGFDIALIAFASLVKRFPQLSLVIAGDGTEKANLVHLAKELGIQEAVEFCGWIEQEKVPTLINEATIVLIPSRSEGLPLVSLQAAQMARPIVATKVDGLPDLVIDHQTGILVESEDSQALANAIAFYLENPDKAIQMGKSAQKRFLELFSMETCVNNYDALYKKLMQKKAKAILV